MNDTVTDLISVTIGQLLDSLLGMTGTFVGTGYVFLSLAFTLSALSGIYQWWTSGSLEDLVANGVRTLIIVAPLLILLNGWDGYMKTFGDFFYRELPAQMGVTGGSPAEVAGTAMKQISGAIKIDVGDPEAVANPSGGDVEQKKSWLTKLWDSVSLANLYSLGLQFLVFILNMLLMFGILFALFMPIASLYLGMIFGPLLLAWLLWKPLADMGARWLSFMIANGLNFVVAVVILKALSKTIEAMTKTMGGMMAEGFGTGLAGLSVSVLALFAIYIFALNLMLAANNIAQGMTGGAAIGEGLFGKLSSAMAAGGMVGAARMTGGGAVKGTAGVMKGAAKAPGVVAKGAEHAGKSLQATGAAAAINNVPGSSHIASAGNAARSVSGSLNSAQKRLDKVGSVLERRVGGGKGSTTGGGKGGPATSGKGGSKGS